MTDQNQFLVWKDIPTKAKIAEGEATAVPYAQVRVVQEEVSKPDIARRVKNQAVAGLLVLLCIAAATLVILLVLI